AVARHAVEDHHLLRIKGTHRLLGVFGETIQFPLASILVELKGRQGFRPGRDGFSFPRHVAPTLRSIPRRRKTLVEAFIGAFLGKLLPSHHDGRGRIPKPEKNTLRKPYPKSA